MSAANIYSINTFTFNGVSSATKYLVIDKKIINGAPERDVERVEIPGRDGDLLLDNKRFRNVDVEYDCYIMPPSGVSLAQACSTIKGWLYGGGAGYKTLQDTYDATHFRNAAYMGRYEVEEWAREIGHVPIIFTCLPFKRTTIGQTAVTLSAAGNVTNPETFESLPLIRVNGSGAGVLSVGSYIVNVIAIDSYVDIDCEAQNAFKGTVNKNADITLPAAGFPRLKAGVVGTNNQIVTAQSQTAISWSGGITSVAITPRWWTL